MGLNTLWWEKLKDGVVSGMHNWIQYYLLEKSGPIHYKGFLLKRGVIITTVYESNIDLSYIYDRSMLTFSFDFAMHGYPCIIPRFTLHVLYYTRRSGITVAVKARSSTFRMSWLPLNLDGSEK